MAGNELLCPVKIKFDLPYLIPRCPNKNKMPNHNKSKAVRSEGFGNGSGELIPNSGAISLFHQLNWRYEN